MRFEAGVGFDPVSEHVGEVLEIGRHRCTFIEREHLDGLVARIGEAGVALAAVLVELARQLGALVAVEERSSDLLAVLIETCEDLCGERVRLLPKINELEVSPGEAGPMKSEET